MNITNIDIAKILQQRKRDFDEVAKIQAVFAAFDKVCSEHGFESYAGFLKKVSSLEGGKDVGAETVAAVGAEGTDRKKRAVVTAELVKQMEDAYASKGEESIASIARKLGVSTGTFTNYVKNAFKYDPKPKGRKPSK